MRRFVVRSLKALVLAGVASIHANAGERQPLEYAVKATFIYKFAPFVTWPAPTTIGPDGAFPLCISGGDRVAGLTPAVTRGQNINGAPIAIRELAPEGDPKGCAILYVAAPDTPEGRRLLDAARGQPILTVTDQAEDHGIIAFRVIGGRVRFAIDEGLAAQARLTISSKLLSLAYNITPAEKP